MTIPEQIYNRALMEGFTKEGACALLANIQGESVFRADNAEDRIHSYGISDSEYVRRADAGLMTYNGRYFTNDEVGFGYAQWTWGPRKVKLFKYAKIRNKSVADSDMQIDFLFKEMEEDFSAQWNLCRTSNNLSAIVRNLIDVWENPYDHQGAYNARYPYALGWLEKFSDWSIQEFEKIEDSSLIDEDGIIIPKTWPPRNIDKGIDGWPEIWLLQSLLNQHGYNVLRDGIFGESLDKKVRDFQTEYRLTVDGIVGPMTWRALGINM